MAWKRQKTDLEKAKLFWIEVNDVTWKLTDGEISRTPASFGQWGGYNTERAAGVGDRCRLALRKGELVCAPRRQLIRADESQRCKTGGGIIFERRTCSRKQGRPFIHRGNQS